MIPFDIAKLDVEYIYVKSVTKALGGSINVVDGPKSREKATRVPITYGLARAFIKRYEIATYLQPVLCAVAKYDGAIVALERHPLGGLGVQTQTVDGSEEIIWQSEIEKSVINQIDRFTSVGDWYTDGVYVYQKSPYEPTNLTSNGQFKSVSVNSVGFASFNITGPLVELERTCVQYTTANGITAISPPIWKTLSTVGVRQMDNADAAVHLYPFDRIDTTLSLNLSFALKAANTLSVMYGYDVIDPLRLDDLMIQLNTVNLPSQPNHLKQTFDIGMQFTHAMAWLIGLSERTKTLESYKAIRSVLKFLTTKGVFYKGNMDTTSIFQLNKSYKDVPMMSCGEALKSVNKIQSIEDILKISNIRHRRNDKRPTELSSIGNLYDAN